MKERIVKSIRPLYVWMLVVLKFYLNVKSMYD
jgi:hypothetical protein